MRKKKDFLFGAFILSASNLLIKLIGAVFRVPLTEIVGVTAMGYFSSAYNIYNLLLSIATAGLPIGISVMISRSLATGKLRDISRIMKIAALSFVSAGAVLSVLGMVFARQIAVFMNSEDAYYAVFWLMPAVFCISVVSLFKGFFQGFGNMAPTATSNLVEASVKLIAGLSIAYYVSRVLGGSDAEAVGGAIAGITLSTFCAMTYMGLRYLFRKQDYRFSREDLLKSPETERKILYRSFFSVAFPVMLSSISADLMAAIDSFSVVNCLKGYNNIERSNFLYGAYGNMALTIFNLPVIFIGSIGVALVPEISSLFVRKEKKALKVSMERSVKTSAIISFACAGGLLAVSHEAVALLFSDDEAVAIASVLLKILTFVIICVGYTTVFNSILNSIKRSTSSVVAIFIGSAIKSIFTFIFVSIPFLNIYGAPLATCIAYPVMMIIGYYFVKKHTAVKMDMKEIFFKPLLSGVLCYIPAKIFNWLFNMLIPSRYTVILTVIVTAAIFFVLILLFKIVTLDELKGIIRKDDKNKEKGNDDEISVQRD